MRQDNHHIISQVRKLLPVSCHPAMRSAPKHQSAITRPKASSKHVSTKLVDLSRTVLRYVTDRWHSDGGALGNGGARQKTWSRLVVESLAAANHQS